MRQRLSLEKASMQNGCKRAHPVLPAQMQEEARLNSIRRGSNKTDRREFLISSVFHCRAIREICNTCVHLQNFHLQRGRR